MKTIGEEVPETNVRAGVTNPTMMRIVPEEEEDECNSSSGSSSIGDDSDADADLEDDAESQNDNIFDDAIQALEQALPIRRGISTFYNGKSKSFTCLANVLPTYSVQDIAKPENAYTRKRKNLGAFKLSSINTGRMRKKPKTSRCNFTIQKDPKFNTGASRPQINTMVNLH